MPDLGRSYLRALGDLASLSAIARSLKSRGWIKTIGVPTKTGRVAVDCLVVFHRTRHRGFDGRQVALSHNRNAGNRNDRDHPLFFGPGYYTSVSHDECTYGGRIHAYAIPVEALALPLEQLGKRGCVFRSSYTKQIGSLPIDVPLVFRDQRHTKHLVFRATGDANVNACMPRLLGQYYIGTYTSDTLPDLLR